MKTNAANKYLLPEGLWAALFLLTPLVYHGQVYDGVLLPKLLVFQICALALLIWCFKCRPVIVFPQGFFAALFAYHLLAVLSVAQSVNRTETVVQLSQYLTVVFWTLDTAAFLRILRVAAWGGLPVALIGLAQYLGLGFAWIPSNANPSATFFHRNAAAEYLIAVLPLAWLGFRLARTQKSALAHAGLLTLLGAFLVCTRTRGAWVGLAGSVVLCAIVGYCTRQSGGTVPFARLKRGLSVAIVLLVALSATLPENLQHTGMQHFDEKKSDAFAAVASIVSEQGHRGRLNVWRHTLDLILDHPLVGVGLGNWQFLYPIYARGDQVNVTASPSRPHNDLLWITSELGMLGLIFYLALLLAAARFAISLLRSANSVTRTTSLALVAVILAHLGEGLFNFPRERIVPALCFWFSLGGLALLHTEQQRTILVRIRLLPATVCLAGLLLASALCITLVRIAYDRQHLSVFIAERRQDWKAVIQAAEAANQYGTLRANTFTALGRARYHTGDLDGAQQAYETALRLHPNYLNTHNNLGIVYRRTGQLDRAENALLQAIYLYPGFTEAHNNLGLVYRDQGRLDEALAAFRKAVDRVPVAQIFHNMAEVYRLKQDLLSAQKYDLRALETDPGFTPARRALIRLGAQPRALPSPPEPDDAP